jgi:regulator of cell morphogenesis and NO signaling
VTKVTFGRTAFTDTCPRTRNGSELEENMGRVSDKTVRDLASTNPSAARTFESFGIDYCCGGERSLAQACSAAKVSVEEVMRALEQTPAKGDDRDWQSASLTELVKHIIEKHHAYVRAEIPRLIALLAKVVRVHRLNHAELEKIELSFRALAEELTLHLLKEERMLFPYIEQLEDAAKSGRRPVPAMFGTVQNPVRMMAMEHDSAGQLLRKMREVTNGYTVPEDGCMSYRLLYRALPEFEADLHEHIHLENNILFPRAIALEEETV